MEKDRRLPFLDVRVTRQQDNTITTTIYQKPTHTNRYFQFTSHHPRHTSFRLLEVYTTSSRSTLQIILNTLHSPVRFNRPSHSTDILENILMHNNRSPIGRPKTLLQILHFTTLYPKCV